MWFQSFWIYWHLLCCLAYYQSGQCFMYTWKEYKFYYSCMWYYSIYISIRPIWADVSSKTTFSLLMSVWMICLHISGVLSSLSSIITLLSVHPLMFHNIGLTCQGAAVLSAYVCSWYAFFLDWSLYCCIMAFLVSCYNLSLFFPLNLWCYASIATPTFFLFWFIWNVFFSSFQFQSVCVLRSEVSPYRWHRQLCSFHMIFATNWWDQIPIS